VRGEASKAMESNSMDKDSSTLRSNEGSSSSRLISTSGEDENDEDEDEDEDVGGVGKSEAGICDRKVFVIANAYLDPGASRNRLNTVSTWRCTCASTVFTPWCKSYSIVSRARARRR